MEATTFIKTNPLTDLLAEVEAGPVNVCMHRADGSLCGREWVVFTPGTVEYLDFKVEGDDVFATDPETGREFWLEW